MMTRILISSCFLVLIQSLWAQDNLQIHNNAHMSNFGQMSVFGDLTNAGEYYSDDTTNSLYFYGSYWQNDINASNSGNGDIHFTQPNPLSGANTLQNLDGGGFNASFARITLNNSNGLLLLSDVQIRNQLDLQAGKITLESNNLKIGDGSSGRIKGYDKDRYIITNGLATDQSGYLIREGALNLLDFPIGFSATDYTPARIENLGEYDIYSIRAFPSVYANGNSGALKNDASIRISWEIIEEVAGGSDVNLTLQHPQYMEGDGFSPERNFIARYVGPASTRPPGISSLSELEEWDFVGGDQCGGNLEDDISTGIEIVTDFTNIRSNLDNFSDYTYYTVYNCAYDVEDNYNFPNAFSPNGDGVNDTWVISELVLFASRKLTIVNRWGDVVYKTESYENDWDGTLRGAKLPAGTYYYIFDLGGSAGIRKGPVTIVRN